GPRMLAFTFCASLLEKLCSRPTRPRASGVSATKEFMSKSSCPAPPMRTSPAPSLPATPYACPSRVAESTRMYTRLASVSTVYAGFAKHGAAFHTNKNPKTSALNLTVVPPADELLPRERHGSQLHVRPFNRAQGAGKEQPTA